MSGVLAALLLALAVALLLPPRSRPTADVASRPGLMGVVPLAGIGAAAWAFAAGLLAGPLLAVVCVTAGAGLGGRAVWLRFVRRRARDRTTQQVLAACEVLAAELGAGRPPGSALAAAASAWPGLAPVAEAFVLGADVHAALRDAASRLPGADDLRLVAAAWQVAHTSGQGLAGAVDRVARRIRAERATRRVVESELASARATARLVAALPVGALLLGSGAGGSPWDFLLRTPAGLACLALGLSLGCLGLWWIEVLADGVERG